MFRNCPLPLALMWILMGCGGGGTPNASPGQATIPAGSFHLGGSPERPGRLTEVRAFRMDRQEVTVGDYAKCIAAGACSPPHENWLACNWRERQARANHPLNCVDWGQAQAFCRWMARRLPSEAEWEYAARGADGRLYPWGAQANEKLACVAANGTCGTGSHPGDSSPFGLLDMAGNVREWAADSGLLPGGMEGRALRGGGWEANPLNPILKFSVLERALLPPSEHAVDIGFRCAGSL